MVSQNPRDDRPPRVTDEELLNEEPPISPPTKTGRVGGGKGGGGLMQTVLISLIVCLVVIVGMSMFGLIFVNKTDFTKNLGSVSDSITAMNKKVTDSTASVQTVTQGIPAQVTDAVTKANKDLNTQISNLNNQYSKLSSSITGYDSVIAELKSKQASEVSSISALNTKVDNLAKSVTDNVNGTLNTKIDTINNKLIELESRIEDLEATPTPTPTPTSTPTPTPTANGLVATMVGSVFNPTVATINLPALTGNTTQSVTGTLTIQIANNTGYPVNNIKLALALGIYDNSNQSLIAPYALPSGITYNLSSGGNLALMWTSQSTGDARILGFINQVNSGTFSFGNLGQDKGTQTYTQIFTLTSNGIATTPNLLVIPTVKVVSYDIVK